MLQESRCSLGLESFGLASLKQAFMLSLVGFYVCFDFFFFF